MRAGICTYLSLCPLEHSLEDDNGDDIFHWTARVHRAAQSTARIQWARLGARGGVPRARPKATAGFIIPLLPPAPLPSGRSENVGDDPICRSENVVGGDNPGGEGEVPYVKGEGFRA